jgi:hypothetical protein
MSDDKEINVSAMSEEEAHQNPVLAMAVEKDSELKSFLVDYVGTKFDEENVTVHMVAETLAHEFPDFMYAMAEENFLRGYQLGVNDAVKGFTELTDEDLHTEKTTETS